MCDGGFDGSGCGDADYEDLDFRLQNPHVYGNDEYMHSITVLARDHARMKSYASIQG